MLIDNAVLISQQSDFGDLKSFLRSQKPYSSIVIISDTHVDPLYSPPILKQLKDLGLSNIHKIILHPGESSKNLQNAKNCWEEMHRVGADRDSLVIGLGGGVITDLAGFVAACYMRGIDVIHIPTTLMGMVDAAIGGKTGVNIAKGKNIVGAIHQPKLVLISPHCLQTLPKQEFIAGLAEIVKYGIIADPLLFELLEKKYDAILNQDPILLNTLIERSCEIKSSIVQKDEKEHGLRVILNLGHTFAHAIEAATNYTSYLHGEAVSIGISCAFYMSLQMGLIDQALLTRLHNLLKKLKLPTALPAIVPETLLGFMYGDKKTRHGKIHLILIKKIGQVEHCLDVDPQIILKVLYEKIAETHR